MDLTHAPSLAPPPGIVSDFEHPDSLVHAVLATNIIAVTLMSFSVGLRLFTRTFVSRNLGWDDCR